MAAARSWPPRRDGGDNIFSDCGSNDDGVVVSIQGVGDATVVEEVQFIEMMREKKLWRERSLGCTSSD